MQKRKIHKSNQPMPIDAIQDALDDIFMGQFTPTEESISQMMSSIPLACNDWNVVRPNDDDDDDYV